MGSAPLSAMPFNVNILNESPDSGVCLESYYGNSTPGAGEITSGLTGFKHDNSHRLPGIGIMQQTWIAKAQTLPSRTCAWHARAVSATVPAWAQVPFTT